MISSLCNMSHYWLFYQLLKLMTSLEQFCGGVTQIFFSTLRHKKFTKLNPDATANLVYKWSPFTTLSSQNFTCIFAMHPLSSDKINNIIVFLQAGHSTRHVALLLVSVLSTVLRFLVRLQGVQNLSLPEISITVFDLSWVNKLIPRLKWLASFWISPTDPSPPKP